MTREHVADTRATPPMAQEVGTAARQVRMVCAFLGVLLREKLAELAPLLPALQAFSIEQSRYRWGTLHFFVISHTSITLHVKLTGKTDQLSVVLLTRQFC
jgi:hypothetical protein